MKRRKEKIAFEEETQTVVLRRFHPVSYFSPNSPEIADNEEELSDSHSFDEQVHAMNENTGGNVGDITFEVEMVEKLHNQDMYLTICPDHQDKHHESRKTVAFLKEDQC